MVGRRRPARQPEHHLHITDVGILRPCRALAVGEEDDLAGVEATRAHGGAGMREREGKIARATERFDAVELFAERCFAASANAPVRCDQPQPVGRIGGRENLTRGAAELLE